MPKHTWLSLLFLLTSYVYVLPTGYNVSYQDDKRHGKKGYAVSSEVEKIQTEIMTGGPVEGAFTVYADFPSYKSGTCFHLKFDLLLLPTQCLTFLIMIPVVKF